MSEGLPKVSIAVQDRVMLHLAEHIIQNDRYVVGPELTRPGIAEACAQHPPNVSRDNANTPSRRMCIGTHSVNSR